MEEVHMGLPLIEGQEVPNVDLTIRVDGDFVQLNTKEQFANKRVILFGLLLGMVLILVDPLEIVWKDL